MSIIAKMSVGSVGKNEYGQERVQLFPVYAEDGPNKVWCDATPSGSLELYISNPSAQGQITQGKHYLVTIEEAPAE